MKNNSHLKHTLKPSACSDAVEWRRCPGFSGYFISEYGDLVSEERNKLVKGSISFDGYICYHIKNDDGFKKQVMAHRMVLCAFLSPPPQKDSQARHLNGSRIFCHISNLAWGTAAENRQDTRGHGTSAAAGKRNNNAKLTEDDVIKIRELHEKIRKKEVSMKAKDLAKTFGIHHSTMCQITARKSWAHIK